MAKNHDLVHYVEDHRVFEHPVVVQLAQKLDLCNSSLVELEVILLQAKANGLDDAINDPNDEISVVSVQSAEDDGKEMNVAILDLPWL